MSDSGHVVLLGDSIFDNAAYTRGGPDVVTQLRGEIPRGWRATLAAVDGAVTAGVERQLRGIPGDASFLVVSAGGNDALGNVHVLGRAARSVAEALEMLAEMADHFERDYRRMLGLLRDTGLPAAVCTVYYPRFPDPMEQRLTSTGLTVYNDVILRTAFEAGLPVIDLRLVCNEDADYANPIEPSSHGGAKIAATIAGLVTAERRPGRTEVWIG